MKKNFYLAIAACLALSATEVKAQAEIVSDYNATTAFDESDYAGETDVVIAGATVTFMNDAMNTCGLPFGDGTQIIMADDSKLVMYNSPDTWYPSPDAEENADYIDYLFDSQGAEVTAFPFNFVIDGDATLVCDSKCRIGGTVTGAGTLTMVVGDSTIINTHFGGFTGKLVLQYRDEAVNQTIQFGSTFPGTCPSCAVYWGNPSCKCWCAIPWSMDVPNGAMLREAEGSIGNSHIAFPTINGECSLYGPATITLKPLEYSTYNFTSVTGGGDNRNFEIFSVMEYKLVRQ